MIEAAVGLSIRPVRDEDASAWERIARSSPDAWLGHSWGWNVDVEERVWGGKRKSLVIEQEGTIVGLLPLHLHEKRRGPLTRRVLYSNYWTGGGLALAQDLSPQQRAAASTAAFSAMHAQARQDNVDKFIVTLPALAWSNLSGRWESADPLRPYGLTAISLDVLVIHLAGRTKDDVWKSMEGRARTAARKAERAGVRVVVEDGAGAFARYYPLHLATYARTGATPHPRAYFETILRSGYFLAFFAEVGGKTIAALNLGLYEGRALYSSSASLEPALQIGANNLLQWHALQWMVDAKVAWYEVGPMPVSGSAEPKSLAIARYKQSLGGQLLRARRGQFVYAPRREAAAAVLGRLRALTRTLRRK